MEQNPIESLGDRIDLIVMPHIGESKKFGCKGTKPAGLLWEMDAPGLEMGRDLCQTRQLVALGINGNDCSIFRPQILNKACAGALVLNQQRGSFLLRLLPGGVDEESKLKSYVYCIPY